jgi:O-acetylhomoserine/O-acetylserine sulfhydrylase-like pyridoxal-dependent enzyme
MDDPATMHFETKALHVGQESDPTTGAVVPPIYQVSTFRLPAPDEGELRWLVTAKVLGC